MTVSLSFATVAPGLDRRSRKKTAREALAGHGCEAPRPLEAMSATDGSSPSAGQVRLDMWSRDRVALLGDAGCAAAPTSGMGAAQTLIRGRLPARRPAGSGNGHSGAFAAYEAEPRPPVAGNQAKGREGSAAFTGGAPPPEGRART
ncbi:hypothetical protein [Streptomyces sennicomposti]